MQRGRHVVAVALHVVVHAVGRHDGMVVVAQSNEGTGRDACHLHVGTVFILGFLLGILAQQVVVRALVGVGRIHGDDRIEENLEVGLGILDGKGGITVAGDLVLEKHVEHEVNGVEAGGIGIQIVNGKEPEGKPEPSQAGGMDERQREIVAKLKPIFYGDEGKARQFLLGIEGMKPTLITQK